MSTWRTPGRSTAWLLCTIAAVGTGCAAPGSTITVYEENDAIVFAGSSDRHYTQGLRVSAVFPTDKTPPAARRALEKTPVVGATTEAIGFILGQNIYTPQDIEARRLQRKDRPYAGWLYAGVVVANVERTDDPTDDTLNGYELDLGIVGPRSYAERVQKWAHEVTDSQRPHGWKHQLEDEPGVVFQFEHRRRFASFELPLGLDADMLAGWGVSVGNVRTDVTGTLTARIGDNIPRDFGVNTIRRTAMEVGPAKPGDALSWYLFAGADGFVVGRNIFLDGNTFRDSHDVDKEYLVGEARGGIAIAFENWRLAYTQVIRTREFREQDDHQDYGSFSIQYVVGF